MASAIKKIGVFTSGGDSPGMNAAIRAVVRTCAYLKVECVGICHIRFPWSGLLRHNVREKNGPVVPNRSGLGKRLGLSKRQ